MFIRYFIEIPRAMAEVETEVLDSPGRWSTEPARDAEARSRQLLADVGFGPPGARLELSISARYTPPLGAFGRVLDRAVLHRVAEATVKDFLDRAAQILSSVPATSAEK